MQNKKILPERIKEVTYIDSFKIIALLCIYAQLKDLSMV